MKHIPSQDLTARPGPEAYFTGVVWMERQVEGVLRVSFTPGARTAWHTHPLGQTLIVLSGMGRVQKRGEAALTMTAGDVVQIDAGEEHWHGAAQGSPMQHLAIQAGETVWLHKVTDEEYSG